MGSAFLHSDRVHRHPSLLGNWYRLARCLVDIDVDEEAFGARPRLVELGARKQAVTPIFSHTTCVRAMHPHLCSHLRAHLLGGALPVRLCPRELRRGPPLRLPY